MMRLVERYEGPLRIESGFVDDTDADAFAPIMIRAAVVAGVAGGERCGGTKSGSGELGRLRRDEGR
jgi:hypothetical protein